MKVILKALAPALAWTLLTSMLVDQVHADPPPPRRSDPISLDRQSPSVVFFGNTPGDIYGEPGGVGFGWDVGGPGPVLHVPEINYGLVPGDNNDGHSNGEQFGNQFVIYFSGDDLSMGAAGTDYEHQAIRRQAAGDRFVLNGRTNVPPTAVLAGGPPAVTLGPVLPGPINLLSANQTRYNEIPSIAPAFFNPYVPPLSPPAAFATVMDDMDALELTEFDTNGDRIHDTPIYFNLDSVSPSVVGGGFTGGDIFLSPPATAGFALWAPFASLGLTALDEVDALAVWNANGSASPSPGDHAIFSLAPGSPALLANGWSAADVLATGFSGTSVLYLPALALGMLPTDNIDGLDVEVFLGPQSIQRFDFVTDDVISPEPCSWTLAAIGLTACGTLRRRRR